MNMGTTFSTPVVSYMRRYILQGLVQNISTHPNMKSHLSCSVRQLQCLLAGSSLGVGGTKAQLLAKLLVIELQLEGAADAQLLLSFTAGLFQKPRHELILLASSLGLPNVAARKTDVIAQIVLLYHTATARPAVSPVTSVAAVQPTMKASIQDPGLAGLDTRGTGRAAQDDHSDHGQRPHVAELAAENAARPAVASLTEQIDEALEWLQIDWHEERAHPDTKPRRTSDFPSPSTIDVR